LRIAFLAPRAEPAFNPDQVGQAGGAERQISLLAHAMHDRGHHVDVLVSGSGGGAVDHGFATIWPLFPLGGIPLVKLLHPKGTILYRFLRERGSTILLQRGASELTAIASAASALRGIPFGFLLASDRDLQPGNEILPHPQDKILYHEALRRCSLVVTQTALQASILTRQYGINGEIIPSFASLTDGEDDFPSRGKSIIWGGNLRRVKRPEWLLAVARALPERQFLVFGGAAAGSEKYAAGIQAEMEQLPNIEYLGAVKGEELTGIYRRGCLLLNTSSEEGFPNTFLEAWHHGLPVLATVDPDKVLSETGLGTKVATIGELIEGIRSVTTMGARQRRILLDKARKYLGDHHSREILAERWERSLKSHVSNAGLPLT
jgi:glycosyltransferase involved in cell wall biosynthesis